MATTSWLEKFPTTKVLHLECGTSDHKSIVIFLEGMSKKNHRPWRFEKMWMEDEGCHVVVESAWAGEILGDQMEKVEGKILICQAELKWWSRSIFGNVL